ncbi:pyridoxamine 5'-phosphate oxidase [Lichenicoccus roseus]|uniref:Pyridoxine/pyridoxamine 5'-phosphate oxidase n=1 Tax=Lichenicoccus roseus TaxID=2683649 RepID=A0A5R9J2N8_9PROT|nr:pyridoxamine 5'-phosphate oxidase [Lichenicoccus roseus]TLU71822.1 pyridoxamine 5'-phosphate oxidase [Lichenicoccus roseus]
MADDTLQRETDPIGLFQRWLAEAEASEPNDPNAMALATATRQGLPSVRMVLLKGLDTRGFVFYTNKQSRKGEELSANRHASLLFHWKSLRRQVRVEGPIEDVTEAEADAYFASRSRGSRLGAIASEQSRPLADRAELQARLAEVQERYLDGEVPRPSHWSGYRVLPDLIEFWQDMPHRLHDRMTYRRESETSWQTTRLYP